MRRLFGKPTAAGFTDADFVRSASDWTKPGGLDYLDQGLSAVARGVGEGVATGLRGAGTRQELGPAA